MEALDPGNPTALIPVDTDAKSVPVPAPVLDGIWQTDGGVASPAVARVVYQDDANRLQQVDTNPAGSQSPIRVSSESGAIERFLVGHDFRNPQNACIAYELSAGGWRITRLGADGSTAPEDFPGRPVVAFNDNDSGAHAGWLTLAGGELRRVFGDGTVGGAMESGISSVELLDSLPDGTAFLNADGDLVAYDPTADQLIPLSSFPEGSTLSGFIEFAPELAVADSDELYYVDNYILHRTLIASGTTEELDAIPIITDAPVAGDRLAVTRTHVVWSYQWEPTSGLGTEQVLRSVNKSSKSAQTLKTFSLSASAISRFEDDQKLLERSGDWFFYTTSDSTGDTRTAVAIKPDGTEIERSNHRWIGANVNPRPGSDMGNALEDIYLLTGGTDPAGESVKSVPSSSPQDSPVTLGTLPNDLVSSNDAFQVGAGIGPSRLARIEVTSGFVSELDIMFLSPNPASLTRVTTPDGTNQRLIDLF